MRRASAEVETIMLPADAVEMADRRLDAIIRRCVHDRNIVESVARSCYLQGLVDGAQLVATRPELLAALRDAYASQA